MKSTRLNARRIAGIIVTAAVVTASLGSAVRPQTLVKPISLGGQALGESFADFKTKFPHATCGSRLHVAEILNGFPDENDVDAIGCCIDSPADLAAFSSREILFLG